MTSPVTVESGKKDAILAAALELFAERGFHGTAVPLVAEKARVGAGTVYRYFESKEALVNAVYQLWKQKLGELLVLDFPLDAPFRQKFHELWRRLARFATQYPAAFAFLERHHHGTYLDETSQAMEAAIRVPLVAFVESAQRQEVLKPLDPIVLMALVYGAFVGLVRASWEHGTSLDDATLDAAEACVWEAIRR
jgi:AcrR family transcriptional regulator